MFLLLVACTATPRPALDRADTFVAPGARGEATSGPAPAFTGPVALAGTEDFACRLGRAGDVNADGYDDLLTADCDAHTVSVWLGSASGLAATPQLTISGSATDEVGASIDGGGDVNGDGYDDIVVGSPGASSGRGCVRVYRGSAAGVVSTPVATRCGGAGWRMGGNVAIAGDLNGDGRDDVVAAPGYGGASRLRVYNGTSTGVTTTPSTTLSIPAGFKSPVGEGARRAGDVNADGYEDLVLGGPNHATGGAVRVYMGSAAGLSATAYTQYVMPSVWGVGFDLGASVSAAGDVDGDGYEDVVAGAPGYEGDWYSWLGDVVVAYGSSASTGTMSVQHLWGDPGSDAAGTALGISVSGGSDFNLDGYDDVIGGLPGRWNGGYGIPDGSWGGFQVFNGDPSSVDADPSGGGYGQSFAGRSVVAAGDLNGDSCPDVVTSEGEWYYWDSGAFADLELGWIFEANVYYGNCCVYFGTC